MSVVLKNELNKLQTIDSQAYELLGSMALW